MSLEAQLRAIEAEAARRIEAAASVAELDALEAEVVGPASTVAEARRGLRDVAQEQRPAMGKLINEVVTGLTGAIAERREALAAAERDTRLGAERVDVTLPGRAPARGAAHLVMEVAEEITDIFVSLGYTVADGPEIETAYYNFDALNTPIWHPARLESDTLYVDHGDDPEGVLLRTQT